MFSTVARLEQSVSTACEHGDMCVHDRAGHGLSAIQLRLALATPRDWEDAIVTEVRPDGWITLSTVDASAVRVLWNHADMSTTILVGEPVALHTRYDVLSASGQHLNVAR